MARNWPKSVQGQRGSRVAFIDLDGLSELWPAPEDDRFNGRLVLANLASITRNFAAAAARTLVMSGVVETTTGVEKYRLAIGGWPPPVVRVTASLGSIADRLQKRPSFWDPDGLAWHLDRAPELATALDTSGLDSIVISNGRRASARPLPSCSRGSAGSKRRSAPDGCQAADGNVRSGLMNSCLHGLPSVSSDRKCRPG